MSNIHNDMRLSRGRIFTIICFLEWRLYVEHVVPKWTNMKTKLWRFPASVVDLDMPEQSMVGYILTPFAMSGDDYARLQKTMGQLGKI